MIEDQSLNARLIELVTRKSDPGATVTRDTPLDGLGLASIDMVEIVFEAEEIVGRELDLSLDDLAGGTEGERTVGWLIDEIRQEASRA